MRDNCGVFGIHSSKGCAESIERGIFHLQHRGQVYAGLSVFNGQEIISEVGNGLVKEVFPARDLGNWEGNSGIGHVSLMDPQPHLVDSKIGKFVLAFSGNLINGPELREKLKSQRESFSTSYDVEVIARLIGKGKDYISGIQGMFQECRGGYSLVLLTDNGEVYAARDPYGFRPLILAKNIDGCAVASESPALEEIGMEVVRDVRPGEIVRIEKNGFSVVRESQPERAAYCAFEWAYIARLDSVIEGIPVKRARNNLGGELAQGDEVEADIVAPIPMSGIGHAQGYHRVSGVPYDDVFLYNRYSDRSYTPLDQTVRDIIANEKLSVIKESIKGKKIIIIDDSIVRGTQMRKQVFRLKKAGANEIHVRVASPPLKAPCLYGISTTSYEELAAVNHSTEEIRKMIGADTLRFNTLEGFIRAIGLPSERLCSSCWTGEYPV